MAKYKIFARQANKDWEVIDTADTLAEAQSLLKEYKQAYGPSWVIWIATKAK